MPVPHEEIIYGRQPVHEALRARRRRIVTLFLKESAKPSPDLEEVVRMAERMKVSVKRVDDRDLLRMTEGGHHQGIAARVSSYPYVAFEEMVAAMKTCGEPPLILIADHIQDPQNLGSILRTAEAAGVAGVILPADRAAAVTPAAVRASAGAAEYVKVAEVTNLVRTMKTLKDEGLWIAGLESVPEAKPYTEQDLTGPLGLVVGSEGEGLKRMVAEHCDFLIKLPLHGKITSLNAGAACAIALYEIRRQRDCRKKEESHERTEDRSDSGR